MMEPYGETCYLWTVPVWDSFPFYMRTVQSQTGTKIPRVGSATDTTSDRSEFVFRPVPCKRMKRNGWREIRTHTGPSSSRSHVITPFNWFPERPDIKCFVLFLAFHFNSNKRITWAIIACFLNDGKVWEMPSLSPLSSLVFIYDSSWSTGRKFSAFSPNLLIANMLQKCAKWCAKMVNATFVCQFTRGCKLGGIVAFTIFVPDDLPLGHTF